MARLMSAMTSPVDASSVAAPLPGYLLRELASASGPVLAIRKAVLGLALLALVAMLLQGFPLVAVSALALPFSFSMWLLHSIPCVVQERGEYFLRGIGLSVNLSQEPVQMASAAARGGRWYWIRLPRLSREPDVCVFVT